MARRRRYDWTTKDGERLKFSEMTTSHLRNTLAMLRRNSKVIVKALEHPAISQQQRADLREKLERCEAKIVKLATELMSRATIEQTMPFTSAEELRAPTANRDELRALLENEDG